MADLAEAINALRRIVDRTRPEHRYIEEVVLSEPPRHAEHLGAVLAELEARPSAEDMAAIDAALDKVWEITGDARDPGAPVAPLPIRPAIREIQLKAAHMIEQLEDHGGPRSRAEAQLLQWASEIHAMSVAMLVRRDPPEDGENDYSLREHCRDE